MEVSDPDKDGRRIVVLPVGSDWHASCEILRFGPEAEVLGPPSLRSKLAETVGQLVELYRA
jgi:predicted DNA-binding transcriptional regulator YafY